MMNDNNPYAQEEQDPYNYDYQPFAQKKPLVSGQATGGASAAASSSLDTESLRLKEQELARREQELQQREAAADGSAPIQQQSNGPKKNFPICYPIVYHNPLSIPKGARRAAVFIGFYAYLAIMIVAVFNLVVAWINIFSRLAKPSTAITFQASDYVNWIVVATAEVLILPFAHFGLSYWPLYKAMESGFIARYVIFFIAYLVPIAFCLFQMAGYWAYGACGIVTTIFWIDQVHTLVLNLLCAIFWGIMSLTFIVVYIIAIVTFRQNRKGTVQELREMATSAISQTGTKLVSQAVAAGVTNAIAGDRSSARV